MRAGATQKVTVGAASAACTNAFGDQTRRVRVCTDIGCYIVFGKTPTATANDLYLPPNEAETFSVNPGEKVAVIQVTTGGFLTVTEFE